MSIKKIQWQHRGIEPVTFQLALQCLNQLRYQQRAPDCSNSTVNLSDDEMFKKRVK
jgi:hypothetical protein